MLYPCSLHALYHVLSTHVLYSCSIHALKDKDELISRLQKQLQDSATELTTLRDRFQAATSDATRMQAQVRELEDALARARQEVCA